MGNAVYVWDRTKVLDDDDFAETAKKHEIKSLFLSVYNPVLAQDELMKIFESNPGLQVYAMASTNEFVFLHEHALEYISQVYDFNRLAGSKFGFSGVHFDVEPYCLPEYAQNQEQTLEAYLFMCDKCYSYAKKGGLKFGLSLPYWYKFGDFEVSLTFDGLKKPLSFHAIDLSDHVSVMAYGLGLEHVIKAIRGSVAYSRKNVFAAVENISALKETCDALSAEFKGSPAFSGIAIHHYDELIRQQ